MVQDPSFNHMAEQLQKTFHGALAENGIPQFDTQQYYSTMQQDSSMSTMLESLANPLHKDQLDERMALIKEDSTLKPILEEIEIEGPAAMMRWQILLCL
ncbi:Ankyrin repeat domain-containing protein 2B [Camellia lanceoleosa]|uniref:Ankyrin repeat domain-containing protein 2B n=1 Tax=Camellia lanceoleosa TaxID=1840588 RepID=A0ACC0HXE2_9ERIC|nr:Ankyrin repeat domain-containing protein 2B [Camellia lanceoleosa]